MRTFLNLSIKWKLVLGFSIGIASLFLVAGTAVFAMTALRDTQIEMQEFQLGNVIDYMALDANLSENRVLLNRMLRSREQSEREATRRKIAANSVASNALMQRLAERMAQHPLPAEKFAAMKAARDEFNRIRDTLIVPAVLAGRQADAEAAFEASTERYNEANALGEELAGLAKDNARVAMEQSIALVRRAVLALSVIALAAVLLSVLAIVALHRAIAVPVTGVAGAATRIAAGELDLSTPGEDRQDEIGDLARAFNRMSGSLRDLAGIADKIADGDLSGQVRPRSKSDRLAVSFGIMSENLKGLTGEMKSGAREINAAAVEILELTREFVVEMADQDKARRFQDTLLRLEELSKRLDSVVGRLKLPAQT